MTEAASQANGLSARRIIGFACSQAFIFILFFGGSGVRFEVEGHAFAQFDQLLMLVFLVVGFAVVRALPASARQVLFARPALYAYAVIMALGSLAPMWLGNTVPALAAQGVLVGFPEAVVLTAWGRTFGRESTAISVLEVFVGSLVAALLCALFSLASDGSFVAYASRLLPLASVVNIEVPVLEAPWPAAIDADSERGRTLSFKMLAGTLLFGMAAGMVEAYAPIAPDSVSQQVLAMVLLVAFLLGGLTLFLTEVYGREAALNRSYRIAVFVMIAGILVAGWPLLDSFGLSAGSLVLAGYLGLEVVFVSLFLMLAEITSQDAAVSFTAGFFALFAGEAFGILVSGSLSIVAGFAISGIAGMLALLSYIFLFTERDFSELAEIVQEGDSFEQKCTEMSERYGLTKRETEILAFALRGRTSERIAQELVISKSTVDTHLRRIYAKCGVHSKQELLDLAGIA